MNGTDTTEIQRWRENLALANSNRETRRKAGMYMPQRQAIPHCLMELQKAMEAPPHRGFADSQTLASYPVEEVVDQTVAM